ncbi:Glutathione S-transferase class-mu isozyme 1 [Araneus ventricosus]|uniref:glutathione transferase n=1 Tax=Araneus ventricosus TaxID=182803 RepID=A0A4Y2AJ93_ARAVE|nr:Glutathione S-transferase class-mu isozyme 1 [Araneus ventricosus]
MPKPILGYWNFRGFCEPIRYLLHYCNVEYEEKKYTVENREEWDNIKRSLNLDFPNLPYWIDDKVRLSQSNTILRYLSEKYGLDGKNEEERLRLCLIEQQIYDLRDSLRHLTYNGPEHYEKRIEEYKRNLPIQMKEISDFLGDRKFMVGDRLTYGDFMAYDCIDFFHYLIPDILKDFPNLRSFQERIRNLPQLQNYFNSPDHRRWPFNSPNAVFGGKGPEPKQE